MTNATYIGLACKKHSSYFNREYGPFTDIKETRAYMYWVVIQDYMDSAMILKNGKNFALITKSIDKKKLESISKSKEQYIPTSERLSAITLYYIEYEKKEKYILLHDGSLKKIKTR